MKGRVRNEVVFPRPGQGQQAPPPPARQNVIQPLNETPVEKLTRELGEWQHAVLNQVEAQKRGEDISELDQRMNRQQASIDAQEQALQESLSNSRERWEQIEIAQARISQRVPGDPSTVPPQQAAAYANQIRRWNGNDDDKGTPEEYHAYREAVLHFLKTFERREALRVGTDIDGGFFVDPDLTGRIVKLIYETSPMRSIAAEQMINSDRLTGTYDLDEVESGWVGETDLRPTTGTPKVYKWEIPVHNLYARPRITENLLEDADFDVEGWLAYKIRDHTSRNENQRFVNGDGVLSPRGFATYPVQSDEVDKDSWGSIQYVASGHATNTLSEATKLIEMLGTLKSEYMMNARWVCKRETLWALRQLHVTDMGLIFAPSMNFSVDPYGTILGHSITVLEDMAGFGTTNNLPLAVGDFMQAYQIVQRRGIKIMRDQYTDIPYLRYYALCRVGGAMLNFEAITFMRQSAT